MIVALCSDLHLELGHIVLENTENAKILILAGDICTVTDLDFHHEDDSVGFFRSQRIHDFFRNCSEQFEEVIYIMGNHEHYHFSFNLTLNTLKERLSYLPNLHIMDRESIKIEDTLFICGTLWSDMNGDDDTTKDFMRTRMNDFRVIYKSGIKFQPDDAIKEHRKMLEFIDEQAQDGKIVVVGHHSPSFQSVHEQFKHDTLMNGGFHSNLDQFIIDRPQIKHWIHGHTHSHHDYMIGETRIVCNPRGYIRYEAIADCFELKYINLEEESK